MILCGFNEDMRAGPAESTRQSAVLHRVVSRVCSVKQPRRERIAVYVVALPVPPQSPPTLQPNVGSDIVTRLQLYVDSALWRGRVPGERCAPVATTPNGDAPSAVRYASF